MNEMYEEERDTALLTFAHQTASTMVQSSNVNDFIVVNRNIIIFSKHTLTNQRRCFFSCSLNCFAFLKISFGLFNRLNQFFFRFKWCRLLCVFRLSEKINFFP